MFSFHAPLYSLPLFDIVARQSEGKDLTKEEKQRLRKEKKQQKKNKEKKDDKASQESEKEKKSATSAAPASQPPTQLPAQKGMYDVGRIQHPLTTCYCCWRWTELKFVT